MRKLNLFVTLSVNISMKNKVKILFVVSEFYQAGTQRFTFELDRALDKSKFEVEILCVLPLNNSDHFIDYYFEKHIELGTKIHFLPDVNQLTEPTLRQKINKRIANIPYEDERIKIKRFFDNFDCISIMGEYNFKEIYKYISSENKHKLLIHIQNSKYQVKNTYEAFPKNEEFQFVSGFHEDQISFELSEFSNFKHTYYNLNLRFENEFVKTSYQSSVKPKIGIFTRLTPAKPLDPFIYSFHALKEQIPDAEFHIFGSGDPIKEGLYRYVQQLNLERAIYFRGHQENILKTAVEEELDLVWLHGYHGLPGGWVGFDISTAKLPQLFWNFGNNTGKFYSFFPMFNSVSELAKRSISLLSNPTEAKMLADEQFNYTNENYNISKNIHVMEQLYLQLANRLNSEK
jgi:glycosyltransferase involved in cell wall biosynthesis